MGDIKHIDTSLVDKAIIFATKAHEGVERNGKGFPYIIHPLEAMSIVATMTNDPELLAAAALHDVIEDTSYTYEDLKENFGEKVAQLVSTESDENFEDVQAENSWRARKWIAMNKLQHTSLEGKMVTMGDKLSNMRAIARDYRAIGDELWNRFHVKDKAEHAWRYRGLVDAFSELEGMEPYEEFKALVKEIFGEE